MRTTKKAPILVVVQLTGGQRLYEYAYSLHERDLSRFATGGGH